MRVAMNGQVREVEIVKAVPVLYSVLRPSVWSILAKLKDAPGLLLEEVYYVPTLETMSSLPLEY